MHSAPKQNTFASRVFWHCHFHPIGRLVGIFKTSGVISIIVIHPICHKGPTHECLGMTVDFRVKGECFFSQFDCLKKLFNSVPEDPNLSCRNTAAPECVFKTGADAMLLDATRTEQHHVQNIVNESEILPLDFIAQGLRSQRNMIGQGKVI